MTVEYKYNDGLLIFKILFANEVVKTRQVKDTK